MSKNQPIRMAVIGVGAMGKKYALIIANKKVDNMILSAVCCRSEENQKWVRDHLGEGIPIFKNVEEMFENTSLFDAVLIVTPHKEHPSIAIKAFRHGKHVFCDKPSGIHTKQAREMNQEAKLSGKAFAMMFHNRTFPMYSYIKEILEKEEIGSIKRILLESSRYFRTPYYHQSASWRSSWKGEGGGALINQGQHILDIWQWLFGMPEAVYARIPFGKYNDFSVDDEVTMLMSYKHNLSAVFILTTGEVSGGERLEIIGTKGKIILEGNSMHYWKNNIDTAEYIKVAQENSGDGINCTYEEIHFQVPENAYIIMLQNFSNHLVKGEPLIAEGKEGVFALMLANAAYLSAWKGENISLPIDDDYYLELLNKKMEQECNM